MKVNVSRGLRFGIAAAGIAVFGFAGGVSAQQAPNEVGAVGVACIDLGYGISPCQQAISTALVSDIVDATNANLADQGIIYVVGAGLGD